MSNEYEFKSRKAVLDFVNKGEWKTWTPEERFRFFCKSDKICFPLDVIMDDARICLGRSIFTHEICNGGALLDELDGKRSTPTNEEIIRDFALMFEGKAVVLDMG